jgi:SAM-dependent methyltransferase
MPSLGRGGASAIREDWPRLRPEVDWETAPDYAREYRREMLDIKAGVADEDPWLEPGYVCIWSSFSNRLCRPPFFNPKDKEKWARRLIEETRLAYPDRQIVVKQSPIPMKCRHGYDDADMIIEYGKGQTDPTRNCRIALHAYDNIIISSSVSNELVTWGCPVTALGRSWFSGFGIFHEPRGWEEYGDRPPIDEGARARWINWWLARQAPQARIASLVAAQVARFAERHGDKGLDYAGLYGALYGERGRRYRAHPSRIKATYAALSRQPLPKTALDVGCGQGELVKWLRGEGVEAYGVDVASTSELEPAEWFSYADARRLPYRAKQFDLVTCTDVLEHIAPEHVPLVLHELARVGCKVYAEIRFGKARTPSPTGWKKTNLHACADKGLEWWRKQFDSPLLEITENTAGRTGWAVWFQET